MSKEGNQKLSLVRLSLGILALCVIYPFASALGDVTLWVFGPIGVAVVVNISAVPNLAARSSIVMVVAAFLTYSSVTYAALPHVGLFTDQSKESNIALIGFAGGAFFAMVAHYLLFRRLDPAMSLFVGALTMPSGLVFTLRRGLIVEKSETLIMYHLAWYLLFALGLGAAAALRGRTVGSRP